MHEQIITLQHLCVTFLEKRGQNDDPQARVSIEEVMTATLFVG